MNMIYDAAIIGTGPAGISAALNLKILDTEFIWLGIKRQDHQGGAHLQLPGLSPDFREGVDRIPFFFWKSDSRYATMF